MAMLGGGMVSARLRKALGALPPPGAFRAPAGGRPIEVVPTPPPHPRLVATSSTTGAEHLANRAFREQHRPSRSRSRVSKRPNANRVP